MRLKRLLASLFFLVTIWTLFLFGRFFAVDKPIENLTHLPENAIFAMRLDGSAALKSTLFSVLLEANDPEVIKVINEQINKKWKRKGVSKNLGIDFLSDIVVYVFPFEGEQMLGMSYNLTRPDLMRKNALRALDSDQCYSINENIGVVLTYLGKKKFDFEKKARAIKMAQKIAFTPIKGDLAGKIAQKETTKLVQVTSRGMLYGSSTLFTRTDVDLTLNEHSMVLTGQLIKNYDVKDIFLNKNYTLIPSGMHFYTTLIPKSVQDSLHAILKSKRLVLPEIEAIAVNYRGMHINNPNGVLFQSPDIDMVLNFKDSVDFIAALKKSNFLKELHFMFKSESVITNGIKDFYITKIDPQTYLFSSEKNAKTKMNPQNCLLKLDGNLTNFTNITGNKWFMTFLNGLPIYFNSKSFFSKTKNISVTVTNTDAKKATLEGRLDFKEEYSPMNEIFKYAVQSNIIRLK